MRLRVCVLSLFIISSLVTVGRYFSTEYDGFGDKISQTDLWDVTALGVRDDNSKASAEFGLSGVYSERLGDFVFLYLYKSDSLLYRGYTFGRNEGLVNDSLTYAWTRPFNQCRGVASFTQHGRRDNLRLQTSTLFENEVVGRGRFVRAVADTISDAWLVRERHEIRESIESTGIPPCGYTIEFHRWYVGADSIPIAIQMSMSGEDFSESSLYVSGSAPGNDGISAEDHSSIAATVLSKAEIKKEGENVSMGFVSDMEFGIEAWLVDAAGHSYGHHCFDVQAAPSEFSFSVKGLPRGSYMLVITVPAFPEISEKRMLTL